MTELNRHWTAGRMRKHLCVRWWGGRCYLRYFPRHLWLWLTGRYAAKFGGAKPIRFDLSHQHHSQDACWCPTGSQTQFRIEAFGFGSWGWLSRNWTEQPCVCDKAMWLSFPDSHQDDIDEYGGLEKLEREFQLNQEAK